MEYYASSLEHILAELERIDLLIRAQVWRARQTQAGDGELPGFYISEQELEALLAQPLGLPRWATLPLPASLAEMYTVLDQLAAGIARHKAASLQRGIHLRLEALARLFQLTPFERDALLVCLAPEIDLRYQRLYAYLHDDLTRNRPSVDLALNLLCNSLEEKLAQRQRFRPSAPLLKYHLLQLCDDPAQPQPPLLGQFLKVEQRIVDYMLDSDEPDARLLPYAQHVIPQASLDDLLLPPSLKRRLALLAQQPGAGKIFYFQGPDGVGKQTCAEALRAIAFESATSWS